MSYKLFLDDERLPSQVKWVQLPLGPYTTVRSYKKFVECIERLGIPSFVTFDHDLGQEHYAAGIAGATPTYDSYKEKTGYDCAKWLVNYCCEKGVKFPDYEVHSMNIIGKQNIIQYIKNYIKNT
jgi:hypothetical protein